MGKGFTFNQSFVIKKEEKLVAIKIKNSKVKPLIAALLFINHS